MKLSLLIYLMQKNSKNHLQINNTVNHGDGSRRVGRFSVIVKDKNKIAPTCCLDTPFSDFIMEEYWQTESPYLSKSLCSDTHGYGDSGNGTLSTVVRVCCGLWSSGKLVMPSSVHYEIIINSNNSLISNPVLSK